MIRFSLVFYYRFVCDQMLRLSDDGFYNPTQARERLVIFSAVGKPHKVPAELKIDCFAECLYFRYVFVYECLLEPSSGRSRRRLSECA